MLCFEYFDNDKKESLMDLQFAMYDYTLSTMFRLVKSMFLDRPYADLYLSEEVKENYMRIEHFDHRLVQGAHDYIAAVFRYNVMQGEFEKDLFEDEDTEDFFSHEYIDTDFLREIPKEYYHLTLKWHKFVVEFLQHRNNIPVLRCLALALFVYSSDNTNPNRDKDREARWDAANSAERIIRELYPKIPWKEARRDAKNIVLDLDREHFPQVLMRYGLEGAKEQAISMALKQYSERPLTETMLYSCLSNLESDLEMMFPPPKTTEEKAEDDKEAEEEERYYKEETAKMKPYLMNGMQVMVNENGEWGVSSYGEEIEGADYPVWETKSGELTARIYDGGWDWIYLSRSQFEDEDDDDFDYEEDEE